MDKLREKLNAILAESEAVTEESVTDATIESPAEVVDAEVKAECETVAERLTYLSLTRKLVS